MPRDETLTPSEYGDAQALGEVKDLENSTPPFYELGVTGLKRTAGYVDEEFLAALKGRKGVQVYREMGDNDPIAGALLFAITQLIRGVDWSVVPGGKSAGARRGRQAVGDVQGRHERRPSTT